MDNKYMSDEEMRRLKSYMVAAGHTITSLAKEIGMTRESLSARINGKIDFDRKTMTLIADKLKARPEEIFFGTKVA